MWHPRRGEVRLVRGAVQLDGQRTGSSLPPPELGEHTEAVLQELGYDAAAIAQLRAAGALGGREA